MNLFLFLSLFASFFDLIPPSEADIYFSSNHMTIYVTKDIHHYLTNAKLLRKIQKTLETAKTKLPTVLLALQNELTSIKKKPVTDKTKVYLNLTLSELSDKVGTCADFIDKEYRDAVLFYNELTGQFHVINRRFIPFIGDAVQLAFGIPGPTAYDRQKATITKLSKAVDGVSNEMVGIEHFIQDDTKLLNNLLPRVDNFTTQFEEYNNYMEINHFLENLDLKFDRTCMKSEKISYNLRNEKMMLQTARDNALLSRPDRNLFPPSFVKSEIERYRDHDHIKTPFFSSTFDIEQLYAITLAETIIKGDKIHSMMSLPLIDATLGFDFCHFPLNLSEKDHRILNTLQKVALKSLDIFACSKEQRHFLIYSSKDLLKCFMLPKGNTYVCTGRHISLQSGPISCKDLKLPSSIAIELSPTLILLKTLEQSVKIICPNSTSTIEIKSIISKIRVGLKCKISAVSFEVGSYDSIEGIELEDHPLEILQIDSLPSFNFDVIPLNFSDVHQKIHTHAELLDKLNSDVSKIHEYRKLTEGSINDLKSFVNHPSFMPLSVQLIIGVVTLLIVIFIAYTTFPCIFRCLKKEPKVKKKVAFTDEIQEAKDELASIRSELENYKKGIAEMSRRKAESL